MTLTIILIASLLCFSAFFSGSETALTATSRARMRSLEQKGSSAATSVIKLTEDKERLIGAILLGNNLVNILASALATSLFASLFPGGAGVAIATAVMTILVLVVLGTVGVETTSFVAVLGAASLAIGLALQGTLSDLAAGVMLILFRPYKLGQFVDIDGTSGTVKDLSLFTTEMVTPDNVQIILPNGKCWGAIITNYSAHDTRRCDLTFGIDYDDSADQAMDIIMGLAKSDARVMSDPAPWIRVTNLNDSSVDITTRLWCKASDYWDLKFHLTKAVKEAFDANGISIPYPTTTEIKKG